MDTAKKIKHTLEKALHEAGSILKHFIDRPLDIQFKNPVSLVTQVDKKAERIIIQTIQKNFPDHAILSEESPPFGNSPCKWIIDPLDGTTNFSHRFPAACVSIGFEEAGIVKVGGVWNPFHNEWFWAEQGKGASLNGKKIRVSKTKKLNKSLLVTGFPYDRIKRASYYLKFMESFIKKTQGLRRLGSAALDLCYVACGRFDGYWEFKLQSWDQAAGALIAKEAGATLSDFLGNPMNIYGRQTLATNGKIHGEMLRIIKTLL